MKYDRKEMIAHLKNLKIRGEGAWITQMTADNIIELLEGKPTIDREKLGCSHCTWDDACTDSVRRIALLALEEFSIECVLKKEVKP